MKKDTETGERAEDMENGRCEGKNREEETKGSVI